MSTVSQQQGTDEKVLGGDDNGNTANDIIPGNSSKSTGDLPLVISTQDGSYLRPNGTEPQQEKRYENINDPIHSEVKSYQSNPQIDFSYAVGSPYAQLGNPNFNAGEFTCSRSSNTLVVQQPTASDESIASSHSSYSGNIQVIQVLSCNFLVFNLK